MRKPLTAGAPHRPEPLWKNRDYLAFMSGQLVSYVATQVSLLALPVLVLATTGSPVQSGLVGVFRSLPYVLLCVPVGIFVDRLDRKQVMRWCECGRIGVYVVLCVVLALGAVPIWVVFVLTLADGFLFVVFDISEIASIPQLVPESQLAAAGAQNIVNYSVATLVGPALAGVLVAVGASVPLGLSAAGYALSASALFAVRLPFGGQRAKTRPRVVAEVAEALRWLRAHPAVCFLGALLGADYFCTAGIPLILITAARADGIPVGVIGAVVAAGGAGAVAGAAVAPMLAAVVRTDNLLLGALTVQALFLAALPLWAGPVALAVLFFGASAMVSVFDVTQRSYRMRLIPERLQGRVNSIYRLLLFGGTPLGIGLSGVVLGMGGVETAMIAVAAGVGLLALVTTALSKVGGLSTERAEGEDRAGGDNEVGPHRVARQ